MWFDSDDTSKFLNEFQDPFFETEHGKSFKSFAASEKTVKSFRTFDKEVFKSIVSDTNPLKPLYELLQFAEPDDSFLR